MSRSGLVALAIVAIAIYSIPSVAADDDDFVEMIKGIEIFQIRRSPAACPVILVGKPCPEENPLYYFKCCGELANTCCFRLQDWVVVLLIILCISIAISIVVNLIRCICCY